MRRLIKWTLLTTAALAALAVALVIAALIWLGVYSGTDWTDDHIKTSSPFHRFVEPFSRENEGAIEALVLQELPIGSDMTEIRSFIDRHFIGREVQKQTGPMDIDYPIERPNPSHISLRVWASGRIPMGSDYLDVFLVLDESDRVQDVVVSCNGDWM
jgi:hypothetical protein